MPRPHIIRVLGAIGLAVLANRTAYASDVPRMTCSQIGSFARQVAQQQRGGVTLKDAVRRLRKSIGSQDVGTEQQLESIVRGVYQIPIFSTVNPEEVGSAYQTACERGQSSVPSTRPLQRNEAPVVVFWKGPR